MMSKFTNQCDAYYNNKSERLTSARHFDGDPSFRTAVGSSAGDPVAMSTTYTLYFHMGDRRIKKMIKSKSAILSILLVFLWVIAAACSPAETSSSTQPEPPAEADVEQAHEEMGDHETETEHEDEHGEEAEHEDEHDADLSQLVLPALEAVDLDGRPLRVIATTSIIGDVVGRIGGDAIELTTLIGPGQDPHSYQPGAADLTAVARADIIFINGWNLEEGLLDDLANISEGIPLVPVNAGIEPLAFDEDEHEGEEHEAEDMEDDHNHGGADPHTWQSVQNVMKWVENISTTLGALDPSNSALYSANAEAYLADLVELDVYMRDQLGTIPDARRVLVTNHDTFGYFARAYGFEILGTVIPGASTLAEPTAGALAGLIQAMAEEEICALFTETTVSDRLAQTVSAELSGCEDVRVVKLFTDALGPAGSEADSYTGMMRANVAAIVAALR
jgi:ABC-type Zn uptake system ZnuABC Zn-binding protein ZnuA